LLDLFWRFTKRLTIRVAAISAEPSKLRHLHRIFRHYSMVYAPGSLQVEEVYKRMKSLLAGVATAAQDPIFGLIEEFKKDTHSQKINLTVGVYQDESGNVPVMQAVRDAAQSYTQSWNNASYLPIAGHERFRAHITELVLGNSLCSQLADSLAAVQTPGGTGALRIIGGFLNEHIKPPVVAISKPTWINHSNIFSQSGNTVTEYLYLNESQSGFDIDRFLSSLRDLPMRSAVVLHACCHNPTGYDIPEKHWEELSQIFEEQQLFPVIDFAYQGFGRGIDEDAKLVRYLIERGHSLLIAYSCSKNFSLYQQRTGAVITVSHSSQETQATHSQLQAVVRGIYSNPPAFGAEIVAQILSSTERRQVWEQELTSTRNRISAMRLALMRIFQECGYPHEHLATQLGMFSYSGLSKPLIHALRSEYGVYVVDSGRVCLAALNERNIPFFRESLKTISN
jgi:aromatic-amino-acid transaminase